MSNAADVKVSGPSYKSSSDLERILAAGYFAVTGEIGPPKNCQMNSGRVLGSIFFSKTPSHALVTIHGQAKKKYSGCFRTEANSYPGMRGLT